MQKQNGISVIVFEGLIALLLIGCGSDLRTNGASDSGERAASLQAVSSPSSRPRGIYVLDTEFGGSTIINDVSMRDGNIRKYTFVTGYTLRLSWAKLEPQQDVYDFSIIDFNINKLEPTGKKLTLLLDGSGSMEPAYLLNTPRVSTYSYTDIGPDRQAGTQDDQLVTRPVPWDSYTQSRFRIFAQALADHVVGSTLLRDHPILANIDLGIPGLRHIRDKEELDIIEIPGYSRKAFRHAVLQSLHSAADQFPNKFVYIGIWKLKTDGGSPDLTEELRTRILSEFDGVSNPRVGFFQEDLSASKDPTGVVSASPNPDGNALPLALSSDITYTMLQATQQWTPPQDAATPGDAMQYAYDTFGTTYFELYVVDIDNLAYRHLLQEWRNFLLTQ